MTDNELMDRAAAVCVASHAGQTDKAGQAYFQHPMRVALRCMTTEQKIVALLHDTIEDTTVTPEYLREQGFSQEIVDAILSVTKRDGESYEDFIKRAAENPIGRVVKLHDLEDNLNVFRLAEVKPEDAQRLTKYLAAYRALSEYRPSDISDDSFSDLPDCEPADLSKYVVTNILECEPADVDDSETDTVPVPPRKIPTKEEYFRGRRFEINKHIRASQRNNSGTNYNKNRIMVTMPDRKVISHASAIDTFSEVLRYIGFSRVEALEMMHFGKYPLVARENIGGKYREDTLGWYVLSKCPNTFKAIYLNEVADALDIPIFAEVIAK
jgi:hypothetical protein